MIKSRKRDRSFGGAIPEFAAALCAFITFMLLPLLNLGAFACAHAVVAYIVNETATNAAKAGSLADARSSVRKGALRLSNSALGKFCGMENERNGHGMRLFVSVTDIGSGRRSCSEARKFRLSTIDPSTQLCEYVVVCNVATRLPIRISVPFFKDTPLVGKDVELCYSASRHVERPDLPYAESSRAKAQILANRENHLAFALPQWENQYKSEF